MDNLRTYTTFVGINNLVPPRLILAYNIYLNKYYFLVNQVIMLDRFKTFIPNSFGLNDLIQRLINRIVLIDRKINSIWIRIASFNIETLVLDRYVI